MSENNLKLRDLKPDPKNARKHNRRNINAIVHSLKAVGAARSIVIDEEGTVLAGNGVVEASKKGGIKKLTVVDAAADELVAVRRTGLSDQQKTQLALADNRVGELSEWDESLLRELSASVDVSALWTDGELQGLLGQDALSMPEAPESVAANADELKRIVDAQRSARKTANGNIVSYRDSEKYLVIVYPSVAEKEKVLRNLRLPIDERYIAASAVQLRLVAANPIHEKIGKKGKTGTTG